VDSHIQDAAAADAVDLREAARRIWAHRWWVLTSVFISASLSVALAFLMNRTYRAECVLIAADSQQRGAGSLLGAASSFSGLAALAGVNIGTSTAETEEALAVLKSREFTESFIQDLHLMPQLFASRWDASTGNWRAGTKVPTPAQAYKYFDSKIRSIVRDKKTGLITVQIEWRVPVQAAAWANQLVERLNAEMRARAVERANASLGYLEKELERTTVVATRDAISRLIEAQVKQRMFAHVTEQYTFRVVDRALPSDRDDPVSPKKLLMLALGMAIGIGIGVARALLIN
jgi:uncharacterized protein involved in exopolysaccharide biosynthesis